MAKLLKLKDFVLISAAVSGDVLQEFSQAFGLLPSAMRARYGFIPANFKKSSYLSSVSRALSTGDIKRVIDKNGKTYLELTSSGKKTFKRRFKLFVKDKRWDGEFMLVIFDIKEEEKYIRERLRLKLEELGFGMLQKSVWISPYHFEEDLREYFYEKNIENEVFVLRARQFWAGDIRKLVGRVWDLNKINRGYEKIIEELEALSTSKKSGNKVVRKAYKMYLENLEKDPLLPKELLPNWWKRDLTLKKLNSAMK